MDPVFAPDIIRQSTKSVKNDVIGNFKVAWGAYFVAVVVKRSIEEICFKADESFFHRPKTLFPKVKKSMLRGAIKTSSIYQTLFRYLMSDRLSDM